MHTTDSIHNFSIISDGRTQFRFGAKKDLLPSALNQDLRTSHSSVSAEISPSWLWRTHTLAAWMGAHVRWMEQGRVSTGRRPSQLKSTPFQLCLSPRNMMHGASTKQKGEQMEEKARRRGVTKESARLALTFEVQNSGLTAKLVSTNI